MWSKIKQFGNWLADKFASLLGLKIFNKRQLPLVVKIDKRMIAPKEWPYTRHVYHKENPEQQKMLYPFSEKQLESRLSRSFRKYSTKP